MPENGSSKKTISGSCTTAAMNCTFCAIPLESCSTRRSRQSASSNRSSHAPIAAAERAAGTPLSAAR